MEPSQRASQRRRRPDGKITAPIQAPTHEAAPIQAPAREAIEVRAYELFLERGCEHGNDLDDWLRAEREVGSDTSER